MMAGSLNKVMLIGNLGADPEIKRLQNGGTVANFRIATSETWRDKASGERREKTEWHSVVVWNENLVKVVEQYVKKGSKLYIEGQLQTRKYQDKNGQDRYATEVVLQGFNGTITLLDSRNDGGGRGDGADRRQPDRDDDRRGRADQRQPSGGRSTHDDLDDDIPF